MGFLAGQSKQLCTAGGGGGNDGRGAAARTGAAQRQPQISATQSLQAVAEQGEGWWAAGRALPALPWALRSALVTGRPHPARLVFRLAAQPPEQAVALQQRHRVDLVPCCSQGDALGTGGRLVGSLRLQCSRPSTAAICAHVGLLSPVVHWQSITRILPLLQPAHLSRPPLQAPPARPHAPPPPSGAP